MSLPEKFKFRTMIDGALSEDLFKARRIAGGKYQIARNDEPWGAAWEIHYVKQNLKEGAWVIEESDNVNHPDHYQGKTEVIDIIEQATTDLNGFQAYCLGNVIKYVMRHQKKGGIEDLKKARWYLNRVIGGESECLAIGSGQTSTTYTRTES